MRIISRKLASALILLSIASSAFAEYSCDVPESQIPLQGLKYRYSVGFDLMHQIMHAANDFTYIAYNNYQGMEIYAAYRTRGPLGFELGYHWTTDHAKNIIAEPGTQLFGATATQSAVYQSKLRIEDYYIDMYWHYKYRRIVELKLGIGTAFERQNFQIINSGGVSDPLATALQNLGGTTTMTARFNVGLQGMFTKRIGGRVLFSYETTSGIKATNCLQGVNSHMFGNSYTIAVGLYYTITGYYNEGTL